MGKNLLDIANSLYLSDKKIEMNKLYNPKGLEYSACDCGCEQDGEGYCMDCD
jgi:hypothetical protein|tara:strand:+ start:44 stop:199 length:156 start_codon:yes stop_codon:yes gene_type:complete